MEDMGFKYIAMYSKKFRGDVMVFDDGTLEINVRASVACSVEDYIDGLEKKAKDAKLRLNVESAALPSYRCSNGREYTDMCRYRIQIETGCVNVPGYDFMGYVFPVESDSSSETLDAVLVPNRAIADSGKVISGLRGTQAVEKCSVCGKTIQRGMYFVFRKQETDELMICGKNCAKKYFKTTLTDSVCKFITSFYDCGNFPSFSDGLDDEEYDVASYRQYDVTHNYSLAVTQMGVLMFGIARMQGGTSNPKYVDCIDAMTAYLENGCFADTEYLRLGREKYSLYERFFDGKFPAPEARDGFFRDMYAWYATECPGESEFIEKLKQYSLYASKGAFMRKGVLSLNMAAWVTKVYLDAHKELIALEDGEICRTEITEYPETGTKISGKFVVGRIYTPSRNDDDDYYCCREKIYDRDVHQTGAEIIDAEKGHSYYISLTKQSPCNYGRSMLCSRKYPMDFAVGEEIELTSARVKNSKSADGKVFHKLTHLKMAEKEAR